MKEFIITNWVSILIVAVTAGYATYLAATRRWEQLRAGTYKLVLEAEKVIKGTKRGQDRFNYVLDQLYCLIPTWLQFFVSEETLREKLQAWFMELKDYLDNGVRDGSNKPPNIPFV